MVAHFYSGYLCAVYIVLFIFTSCDHSKSNIRDGAYFGADESMGQEITLKLARRSLYENDLDRSDSLLHKVDSLKLSKSTSGFYYLTKGFLDYKNGYVSSAINYIEKASVLFDKYGNEESKAEENLVWGLIYEEVNLPSKAAESFYSAMEHYQMRPHELEYYYLVLGLARTSPDKEMFLKKAEESLKLHSSSRNFLLYYRTMAYINRDKYERHRLYLNAYKVYKNIDDSRGEINLLASLALSCQIIDKNDSANYYLTKADSIARQALLPNSRLIHYYLIKAYVDTHSGKVVEAESIIDSTISYAKDQPALLSEVYLRKSEIESIKKDYAQANTSLLRHLKYEKANMAAVQNNQIAFMSIRYKLDQRQIELLNVRNFSLMIIIGLLLIILILGIVFFVYKRNNYKEKQKLKDLISLSVAEKHELELKFRITKDRLVEQNAGNKEKLESKFIRHKKSIHNPLVKWDEFRMNFIYNNPLYFDKLLKAHHGLTSADIKYCVCVYSRLSNQQAAILLEVSQDAVKKAKQKLRNKFQLDSVQELPNYLQSIDQNPIDNT